MPRLGGVTVHVTDIKGNDLEEWGVQRLPSQGRASAYIKSTSNMGFRVTVRPRLPFMDPWVSARDKGLKTNMKMDRNKSYSSPIKPPRGASYSSPPPFHLLASLFLDGRQKPERRIVVYLDPDDEDFSQPDGKVKFKSRWVQGHDGNLEEHSWVFRDIGIESAFDKLFIGGIQDQSGDLVLPDEESMIALMDSAKIGDGGGLESHERPNVGQISVTLQRVVLGKKWIQDNYRPKHKGNEMQDVDMGGIKQEITHTAGLEHTATLSRGPIGVVHYWPYDENEGVYATFQFFYRNQETLEKFNFPGFPRSIKLQTRDYRSLDNKLINMTPLSIAHPMQSKKRKGKTFEEQIKERSLVPTGKPKFSFNENYREMVTSKGKKPNTTSWKQKDHIPDSSSLPLIKEPTLNSRTNENKKLHSTPPSDLKAIELKTFSACTEPLAETGKNSPSFSVPSLPKLMITPHTISAKVLGSSTNFTSRTASSFASACPNITEISANSKQTSLFNRSTISPEDIQKLNTIPKVYRDCSQASDADDERSDIESQIQDNDSRSEVREPFSKQEQDDTGLPSMMEMVSFGKKRRASHDDDDDDDENNDERSAGDSSASNAIMNFVTPPENGEMERESLDSTKHGTSHESGKVVEDELIAKPGQAKSSQHQCAKRVKI